eukprot:1138310-Rhodomonas_salina.1
MPAVRSRDQERGGESGGGGVRTPEESEGRSRDGEPGEDRTEVGYRTCKRELRGLRAWSNRRGWKTDLLRMKTSEREDFLCLTCFSVWRTCRAFGIKNHAR